MMTAKIMVQTQHEGFHSWPTAPGEVYFLQQTHRHMFHVKLSLTVSHSDREKEFFIVQRWLKSLLGEIFGDDGTRIGSLSCEDIATEIVKAANQQYMCPAECEVWEDGENGACVTLD